MMQKSYSKILILYSLRLMYCKWNSIVLNSATYMHISQATKDKIRTQYTLCNTPLTPFSQYKYLGVIIQSDLKWNHHVEVKVTKVNQMIAMI